MTDGKGGVGVTTLSVQLAIALAEQGSRVVLVDADLHRADVAMLCGLSEQRSVADVLSSRNDIHEVLVRGPAGVLVVPGLWAPGGTSSFSESTQLRLLKQLRSLGRHADIVLLDVGSGSNEVVRHFWQAADNVVLVTTPDSVAVMDCYATIKTLLAGDTNDTLQLIVNRTPDENTAADVQQRIDQSCRRFLGMPIHFLGYVPDDASICAWHEQSSPSGAGMQTAANEAVGKIATTLLRENLFSKLGPPLRRQVA